MYENYMKSDFFYYLLSALFGGIVFVYVVKKLLYQTNKRQNQKTSEDSSIESTQDLILTNNNYPNGKAIKANGTKKIHKSVNNNESEGSEVSEELIKSEKSGPSLETEVSISSENSDFESNTETTPEEGYETEVIETGNSQISQLLSADTKVPKVRDLAAIILTDDNRSDWFEIVCITSGSDVIDARYLKPEFVVVDCRAPVLARRCLIRYLYKKLSELVKHEVEEKDSLFTAIPASNRFELKKNFKLNLYLSEPPDSCTNDRLNIANGLVNGLERKSYQSIKLKSTIDKISVWNQVGVQGSLLSHFIDAIFLNSVIIPVEFNQKSFHQHFLQNYTKEPKLTKCEYNLITDITERIDTIRLSGYRTNVATNWIKTEDSMEVIDCITGKAIIGEMADCTDDRLSISRLSKHELNKCFREFLSKYEYNLRPNQSLPMTYRKWKESAPNYRIQKQLLKVRYAVAGRQWICLPSDLDLFV